MIDMLSRRISYWLIMFIAIAHLACRKPFNQPEIYSKNNLLAIDGFVNTNPNAVSTFTLTRPRSLGDTTSGFPFEPDAQLSILSSSGDSYPLSYQFDQAAYISKPLNLDNSESYKLSITMPNGNHYESDFVTAKPAPPIDSITWALVNDPVSGMQIQIFVNAHDPYEATHYYRWNFLETYEHLAHFQAQWGLRDGFVYPYSSYDSGTYYCYTTLPSQNILLGSSIALSSDVISHILISIIPENDRRLDVEYSMLLRQYPLTADAYTYWLTVQKNSQSLGGLFDLQPSLIQGNYHSTTHTTDLIIGFLTAGSVFEKRIFISHDVVPDWKSEVFLECGLRVAYVDPLNYQIYNYPDTSYGPYYFSAAGLMVAPNDCIDCRYQSGSLEKPSYWP